MADYIISNGVIENKVYLAESMFVWNGGIANNTTVNSGGKMDVWDSGAANDTTINYKGQVFISSGGTATNTIVNSQGQMHISSAGTANSNTVNYGGLLYVSAGGTATEILENGGCVDVKEGANVTFVSNTIEALTVVDTTMTVHSNTIANSINVNNNGYLRVFYGGVANSTTVNYYGDMYIYIGGVANSTTVNYGGNMYIYSGGVANSNTVNSGGDMYIYDGGTASNTKVNSGGYMGISHGGTANSTTLYVGGYMNIYYGTANSTTINSGGYMYVDDNSVANNTTVNYGGYMFFSGYFDSATDIVENGGYVNIFNTYYSYVTFASNTIENLVVHKNSMTVHSNTIANSTTLNYDGYIDIFNGGVVNNTMINSGGSIYMYNGEANGTTINLGGKMYISSGGVANSTTINSGGYMHVGDHYKYNYFYDYYTNGAANNTTVNSGGHLYINVGVANNTTLTSGGCIHLSNGVAVNSTTINASCSMTLVSGCVASSTTIASGGILNISSGAVHRGTLKIDAGATVAVYKGGCVDFTVAGGTAEGDYLINDLSRISGVTTYTITVSTSLASGTYKLAQGAEKLAGNISIGDGKTNYGNIRVNGDSFQYGEVTYVLTQANGDLTLTIDNPVPVTPPTPDTPDTPDVPNPDNPDVPDVPDIPTPTPPVTSHSPVTIYSAGSPVSSASAFSDVSIQRNYILYASSGGSVTNLDVTSGGTVYASDKAVFSNLNVSAGGSAVIYDSVVLSGKQNYTGSVYFFGAVDAAAANVYFDLTNSPAENKTIVNSLALLNAASYNVTVSATQQMGIYKLAGGAERFTGSISIGDGTTEYGTVKVNSSSLQYGEVFYTLKKENGNLTLTVSDTGIIVPPTPEEPDIPDVPDVPTPDVPDVPTPDEPDVPTTDDPNAKNSPVNIYYGGKLISGISELSDASVKRNYILYASRGGTVNNLDVTSGGIMYASHKAAIAGLNVAAGGSAVIYADVVLSEKQNYTGSVYFFGEVNATAANVYFDLTTASAENKTIVNSLALLDAASYNVTVSATQQEGIYRLAGGAEKFTGSISLCTADGGNIAMTINGAAVKWQDMSFKLLRDSGTLSLAVVKASIAAGLESSDSGVSFADIGGNTREVHFSTDNFASILAIAPNTTAVDIYGMPAGTYQWQVCADGTCYQGDDIKSENSAAPQKFISDADGDTDLFLAKANGIWEKGYTAEHQGILNGWTGTKEQIVLEGKNKIADVFTGATDANVLVLTDDTNGDALFVDDIYTAFGDQARLSQINEIRAGAGNDIIDLTSQQFAYVGNGVKVYGGAGNDTIWANSGNNTLFGDAGDDRIVGANGDDIITGGAGNDGMNGGGGNDTFCFGANFGNDTVEQLSGGSVTLHFETGSEANWNKETLTYSDGANSVKVSGVTDVTLVFGEPAPVAGAFLDAASEKIFEDKNKGMIA